MVAVFVLVDVALHRPGLDRRLLPPLPLRRRSRPACRSPRASRRSRATWSLLPAHRRCSGRRCSTSTASTSSSAAAAGSTSSSRSCSACSSRPPSRWAPRSTCASTTSTSPRSAPQWEYSQARVRPLRRARRAGAQPGPLGAARATCKRMWAAGYNVKRVLVAGAGELGRQVAETIAAHRELGYRVVGFVDDDRAARSRRRPARAGHAGPDHAGGAPRTASTSSTSRCRSRSTRKLLQAHQERQQRVPGHQGRARPRAVRDDQGRARGPRRHPDHQPERGPAARLEQHGQARDGHGAGAAAPAVLLTPALRRDRPPHQLEGRQGPDPSAARSA